MVTEADIDRWFGMPTTLESHPGCDKIEAIYVASRILAQTILRETPPTPDQTVAIRKLREAAWTAAEACRHFDYNVDTE